MIDGDVERCTTFGTPASFGPGRAADPSQEIQIYSVSKWVTATVVMTMVQDGILHLDDLVKDILDDVLFLSLGWNQTQVKHLLANTSGIPPLFNVTDACSGLPVVTLKACARVIALVPLLSAPGVSFRYGGPGWQVLAAVAAEAADKSWHDLLDERLLTPCGLSMEYGIANNPNPDISAGLHSDLFNLSEFAELQRTGYCQDGAVQVLTQHSLDLMRSCQRRLKTDPLSV